MSDVLSSQAGSAVTIPKLLDDGSNWVDYSSKALDAMGMKGLSRHVDGSAVAPKPFKDTNGILTKPDGTVASEKEIEEKEEKLEEYARKQHAARYIIQSSVSLRLASVLRKCKTAAEMWETVESDATTKSHMYIIDLEAELQAMKCQEGDDVRAHLNGMVEQRDKLAGMGHDIDDLKFSNFILSSMPLSYRMFLSAITKAATFTGRPINPGDLIRVIQEEAHYREYTDKTSGAVPLNANASTSKPRTGKSNGDKSDVKCHNCKKVGHYKADCWAKGGGKEGQGPGSKKSGKKNESAKKDEKRDESANTTTLPNGKTVEYFSFCCTSTYSATAAKLNISQPRRPSIIDCGASSHFSPNRADFVDFHESHEALIRTADGKSFRGEGYGDLWIHLPNGSQRTRILLKNVQYSPKFAFTLISVSRLASANYTATFQGASCCIATPGGRTIATIPMTDGLYRVALDESDDTDGSNKPTGDRIEHANVAVRQVTSREAHRILGHISYPAVRHAIGSGLVQGLELVGDAAEPFCEPCALAKTHRLPFPKEASNRATAVGERVHADLWGPAEVFSLRGMKYTVDFTDDFSRFTDIDFLKTKDQTFAAYKRYEARMKAQHGVTIQKFRTDRGTEFLNEEFDKHLDEKGTVRELTVHDTHEQVGVAERLNRTKLERARAMLFESGLPKFLWEEAIRHAIWLKNRMPTRALKGKTPFEAKTGEKPQLGGVPPFGTPAYVKLVKASKLEYRAVAGYFVGMDSDSRGYRIYFPEKRRVSVEREVRFNLDAPDDVIRVPGSAPEGETKKVARGVEDTPEHPNEPDEPNEPPQNTSEPNNTEEKAADAPIPAPNVQPGRPTNIDGLDEPAPNTGRGFRARPEPGHYKRLNRGLSATVEEVEDEGEEVAKHAHAVMLETAPLSFGWALATSQTGEPLTMAEALAGPDAEHWQAAWDAEIGR